MIDFSTTIGVISALLISMSSFFGVSQGGADNYTPLESVGKMPAVFVQSTESKIEAELSGDRGSMTEKQKIAYLEHIHYNIDELLHSGLVLYGDPATKYVQKVADNLLNGAPKLKKELQFYVIRSNVTNALSTDQGIIFVTLGLLAQVENEAQLAYVISHEIAHYQENHVEESYEERIGVDLRSSYDSRIRTLSNHSKKNELAADKLGIKLYHEAGYAKSELLSAFDVLMYSYLPFDEVAVPKTYFNTERLFIPEMYFPEEINAILAEEDYDDEKSSHPNIRKRKDAIFDEVGSYSDWGESKFSLSQDEFQAVRNVARYEGVRLDLLDCNYADALYSIFLLEDEHPNDLYLAKCKAQAWLGLASFKLNGGFAKTVTKPSKVEGESHAMHFFLRKLSKLQMITVAMREVEDVRKSFPNDTEVKAIFDRMVGELAKYSRFKLTDFRRINYETALDRFEKSKEALIADTIVVEDTVAVESDEELSKYDKIKKKRNVEEAVSVDEEFDIEQFHIYALTDLLESEDFKRIFRTKKDEIEEEEAKEDALNALSYREREKAERETNKITVDEIVLLEPMFTSYYYSEDKPKESALVSDLIIVQLKKYLEKFDIGVYDATVADYAKQNTDKHNERMILMNYLRQRSQYEDNQMFPVDYGQIQEIIGNISDTKVLFSFGSHTQTRATSKAKLTFILFDLKTGEAKELDTATFRKPKKMIIEGYVYDILSKLNTQKK
jgi:hypothetical protein